MLTLLGWIAVAVLIGANALFVAAEFALTSVDRSKLTRLASEGDRRAQNVLAAVRELSFQLSGAQLGITICSLLLGFVAEPVIASALESMFHAFGLPAGAVKPVSLALALLVATIAQMLFGELIPQNLALARPLGVARAIVPLQRGFSRICRPVIAAFNNTANAIVRALGVEPEEELRSARTPGELSQLFGSSAERGLLPAHTARLLNRALRFADKNAEEVMTPRVQLVALRVGQTTADLMDLGRSSGRSRFPVYDEDLDDIVGVVHIKQVFAIPPEQRPQTAIETLMQPPLRVPASLGSDALLTELRDHEFQLAVVIDEYGGTAGVVTTEDLVEELVGQVVDEHDEAEAPDVLPLSDGSWSVSGRLHKDAFSEIGLEASGGHYDTIAGLLLEQLGRIPVGGESVVVGDWRLTAMRMDGNRIDRVVVTPHGQGLSHESEGRQ
ncbi:MAG: magnesium and cobalt exporter, family [Pseudonocardiales bacterium]|nr:magnesium and cobalt exporter, family [Pseudonocardiales bacterium]